MLGQDSCGRYFLRQILHSRSVQHGMMLASLAQSGSFGGQDTDVASCSTQATLEYNFVCFVADHTAAELDLDMYYHNCVCFLAGYTAAEPGLDMYDCRPSEGFRIAFEVIHDVGTLQVQAEAHVVLVLGAVGVVHRLELYSAVYQNLVSGSTGWDLEVSRWDEPSF